MNPELVGISAALVVAAIAHAWVGERYVLPHLVLMPDFQEMLGYVPSPRVRGSLRLAWQLGTFGILCQAALLIDFWWADTPSAFLRAMAPMILIQGSAMVLGAYLASLLRSKIGHPGIALSLLLWTSLALVVMAAWQEVSR